MRTIVAVIVVVAVLVSALWLLRHRPTPPASPVVGPTSGRPAETRRAPEELGAFPADFPRAEPRQIVFDGCPPQGDAGDPDLNRLKNRVDEPDSTIAAPLDSILALPWPRAAERRDRAAWSASVRRDVARHEGLPVSVTGYFVRARTEGPESPNCHGADPRHRDWHIWMTATPDTSRLRSVVVETTPRVRARHPAWTIAAVQRLARQHRQVRVTGWLMLDPEHPDQVGKTRGTIWEVHPITAIEVLTRGRWVPLDQASTRER